MNPQDHRKTAPRIVLGIDGGGTATRARAEHEGVVVHEGLGGPGNPLAVSEVQLARSFAMALDGCPEPSVVAACVAGTGAPAGRERVHQLLDSRFPRALIRVEPDYVAAFMAAHREADVVVIAGTGSIVCSRGTSDGSFQVTGGNGWIVGDHGSAARLGRAFVDYYCAQDVPAPSDAQSVQDALGHVDPRQLIRELHVSRAPAAYLARAAPLLTAAAEDGRSWAHAALTTQMQVLSNTTAHHIARWCAVNRTIDVGLAGGVWRSAVARTAFEKHLVCEAAPTMLVLTMSATTPVHGAVRLGFELTDER